MFYVYIIKSLSCSQLYVGYTTDVTQRLKAHNAGDSFHTAKYKPWELVVYLAFADREKPMSFEKYLKSQSGRAFMQKRLV